MAINIAGLKKEAVLAVLFNASKQQGLGFLDSRGANGMTEAEAAKVIEQEGLHFDYLRGRVMKVSLDDEEVDEWRYDRDNGQGAAALAIDALRKGIVEASEHAEEAMRG